MKRSTFLKTLGLLVAGGVTGTTNISSSPIDYPVHSLGKTLTNLPDRALEIVSKYCTHEQLSTPRPHLGYMKTLLLGSKYIAMGLTGLTPPFDIYNKPCDRLDNATNGDVEHWNDVCFKLGEGDNDYSEYKQLYWEGIFGI